MKDNLPQSPAVSTAPGMGIEILYKDSHLAVCRKAPGILSEHTPQKDGAPDLLAALLEISPAHVYPVHRLDRTTGGLMVFALDAKTAAYLSEQIRDGGFSKVYLALAEGELPVEGTMTDQLYFDRKQNKSFTADKRPGTKEARLQYRVLRTLPSPCLKPGDANPVQTVSLCRVVLETGRTHQIRVQFASRKHPLVGDRKYGSRTHTHECALWAAELSFAHPGDKKADPPITPGQMLHFTDNAPGGLVGRLLSPEQDIGTECHFPAGCTT